SGPSRGFARAPSLPSYPSSSSCLPAGQRLPRCGVAPWPGTPIAAPPREIFPMQSVLLPVRVALRCSAAEATVQPRTDPRLPSDPSTLGKPARGADVLETEWEQSLGCFREPRERRRDCQSFSRLDPGKKRWLRLRGAVHVRASDVRLLGRSLPHATPTLPAGPARSPISDQVPEPSL